MARVLGIGIATLDIINTVQHYPAEDDEVRALSQRRVRGGNVTNTLCVLSQLGHSCSWLGTLANEPDAKIIRDDLDKYNIDIQHVRQIDKGKVPTSYITLNAETGSRTIVHYRDLEEVTLKDIQNVDFSRYDWVHVEGRNVAEMQLGLAYIRKAFPDLTISIEIEKKRDQIDTLFPFADLLLFSKHFAMQRSHVSAESLLSEIKDSERHCVAICTWADEGAYLYENELEHVATEKVESVVDSVGAGDTFNAGIIHARLKNSNWISAVGFANEIAARKIQQIGYDGLVS